jgi:uncharacterized protein (DUF849 family)
MRLINRGRFLIDVGLNEFTTREQNPHVPLTPEEVARDAIECVRAGAASVHFHARAADGSQAWGDAGFYRQALELVAQEIEPPLWYTTYSSAATPDSPDGHGHDWELIARPPKGAPLQLMAFDVPQRIPPASLCWNEAERRFERVPFETVSAGREVPTHPPELAQAARLGARAVVGAFDVGEVRWAVLAARAGVLATPCILKLVLCGNMLMGPFPNPQGIDAYLSQIPAELDVECMVEPYLMADREACKALLAAALERGLGVRVGIGDNPAIHPRERNAELVERVVELARARGLAPASPGDVRERLGLEHTRSRG